MNCRVYIHTCTDWTYLDCTAPSSVGSSLKCSHGSKDPFWNILSLGVHSCATITRSWVKSWQTAVITNGRTAASSMASPVLYRKKTTSARHPASTQNCPNIAEIPKHGLISLLRVYVRLRAKITNISLNRLSSPSLLKRHELLFCLSNNARFLFCQLHSRVYFIIVRCLLIWLAVYW